MIRITSGTPDQAVSLEDARTAARANGTELDGELSIMIAALTAEAEHATGLVFVSRTYHVTLDEFPAEIAMPARPVAEVLEINYVDAGGVDRTLDAATYRLIESGGSMVLAPMPGVAWPETSGVDAVKVDVICGHGSSESATPAAAKGFILARIRESHTPNATPSPYLIRSLDSLKAY